MEIALQVLCLSRLGRAMPLVQVSALTPCAAPSSAYAALGQGFAGRVCGQNFQRTCVWVRLTDVLLKQGPLISETPEVPNEAMLPLEP